MMGVNGKGGSFGVQVTPGASQPVIVSVLITTPIVVQPITITDVNGMVFAQEYSSTKNRKRSCSGGAK